VYVAALQPYTKTLSAACAGELGVMHFLKLREIRMVYLNLSVENIELTKEFYADKLNFFRREAGRLVCTMGVDLILDLVEVGSEHHMECFGQNSHVPSDFWIHAGGGDSEEIFEVLDHLQGKGVNFENIGN